MSLERHPMYKTWNNMMSRCYVKSDDSYKNYGARGIGVCEEWKESKVFLDWCDGQYIPEEYTLDRIDNNKGYSPDNCKFSSWAEQNYNTRRRSDNTSGRTGVGYIPSKNKWRARINKEGKEYHLGIFDSFEEAVEQRKKAELELYGRIKTE